MPTSATTPAATRRDALDRLALVLLGLLLLLLLAVYLARMPQEDWTAVRVLPPVALAHGFDIYPSTDSGAMLPTVYGPVKELFLTPAALASTPTGAIAIAGLLNMLAILVPLAWLLGIHDRRDADPRRGAWGLVLGVAAWLLLHPTNLMLTTIHVDAVAIGLCLVACRLLLGDATTDEAHPPGTIRLAGAAVCAVLAVWTKQIALPLAIAMVIWSALAWPRAVTLRLLGWLALFGVVVSGLFVAVFGFGDLWLNLVTVPGSHPYRSGDWLLAGREILDHSALCLVVVLVALYRHRRAGTLGWQQQPWTLLLLAAVLATPLSVLARAKVGGWQNSLYTVAFVLVATVWILTRGDLLPAKPERAGRWLRILATVAVVLTLPSLGHPWQELGHWRDNPQEVAYRYALDHPGEVYFPWNPLSHLLAEGELYHFDYAVYDRAIADLALDDAHVRRHLPATASHLAFYPPSAVPDEVWLLRHLPEVDRRATTLDELPGWTVFVKD